MLEKNNSTLISVFDRIQTKIDSNDPLMSKKLLFIHKY